VAVAQVAEAASGTAEAAVHGLLAVYRPDSGIAEFGAARGGFFEPDAAGLEGRTRRRVQTDLDAWHWEGLELPAGVRFAPFRYTAPTGTPLAAVARFGPEGIEGKLTAGPFRGVSDAVLWTPTGRNLSLRLGSDGTFHAGTADILPPGQFLAGAVLSDRQQRRQELYRTFLDGAETVRPKGGNRTGAARPPEPAPKRPAARALTDRNVVLAWADPIDMHFTLVPEARTVGAALLSVPLRLEPAPGGTRVRIPGPLVPYRRLLKGVPQTVLVLEGTQDAEMHLRFQLPQAVLPLTVERARLLARVAAPSRRVTVAAPTQGTNGGVVEIHRADSPLDPIRLEIAEPRFLRLDEQGGLHLMLSVSDSPRAGKAKPGPAPAGEKWTIEYLELEVVGQTQ
jgi:hypothetical protein